MSDTSLKRTAILLGVIVVAAAITRLAGLSSIPPSLIPDEASNGYDAYCLLETGRDRWGASFPIHLEAFGRGDFRPALYAYLTVPFVRLLGLDQPELTTRLPAACWAVLTIVCMYLLVCRVSDRRTALWAALFLTLSPWHIRISRFGHESALTPGFLIFALLLLVRAGWPLRGGEDERTPVPHLRRWWMVAFGAVVGLSFYSYASMRLFMPAMMLAGAWLYRDTVRRALKRRQTCGALTAGLVAFVVILAPLAWAACAHWDQVSGRARYASLFHQGLSAGDAVKQVGAQYLAHFGPTWLFISGDSSALSSTPGVGQLNWYMAPLLAVGLFAMWRERKRNRTCLLAFAWLLLHPLASALCTDGPHTNRAACGIGVFSWIAAVGVSTTLSWFPGRSHIRKVVTGALLAVILVSAAWSARCYVADVRSPSMGHLLQTDLREAVIRLRDRWSDYDRIFISDHTSQANRWANLHPYVYVLTYLPIEPARFQAWEKVVGYRQPEHGFHYVESMGPFTFSTQPAVLDEYFQHHRDQKALFVARPDDVHGGRLLETICDRTGEIRFEIIEVVP